MTYNIGVYDQVLARANSQFDALTATLAGLTARHGQDFAMADLIGLLASWDPTEVQSILAAAVLRNLGQKR